MINISFITCFFIFRPLSVFVYSIINATLFSLVFIYIDTLTIDIIVNFSLFHFAMFLLCVTRYRAFESNYKDIFFIFPSKALPELSFPKLFNVKSVVIDLVSIKVPL